MKIGNSISLRGAAAAVALAAGVALGGPALAQGKVLKFVPEADLRILDRSRPPLTSRATTATWSTTCCSPPTPSSRCSRRW